MNNRQFLDLKAYRRKRMVDAAKMLPVLGAILVLFPLPFLFSSTPDNPASALSVTRLAIYIFSVWLALITGGMILSRKLGRPDERT